jgi:hypothetical protein
MKIRAAWIGGAVIGLCALSIILVSAVETSATRPFDVIVLFDVSASTSGYYIDGTRSTRKYATDDFLKEFVFRGDSFHLISFSETPRLEISRKIENDGSINTIKDRLSLLLPIEPYSDINAAISYAEEFAATLPSARPKQIVVFSDGIDTPSVSEVIKSPTFDAGETEERFKEAGYSFFYIKEPVTAPPVSGRRPAQALTVANPVKPVSPVKPNVILDEAAEPPAKAPVVEVIVVPEVAVAPEIAPPTIVTEDGALKSDLSVNYVHLMIVGAVFAAAALCFVLVNYQKKKKQSEKDSEPDFLYRTHLASLRDGLLHKASKLRTESAAGADATANANVDINGYEIAQHTQA